MHMATVLVCGITGVEVGSVEATKYQIHSARLHTTQQLLETTWNALPGPPELAACMYNTSCIVSTVLHAIGQLLLAQHCPFCY